MNHQTLSLLGCSASLVLVLAVNNPALASTPAPQYTGYEDSMSLSSQAEMPSQWSSRQSEAVDRNSQSIEELAIAKFGCDCPGCRNAVTQMRAN